MNKFCIFYFPYFLLTHQYKMTIYNISYLITSFYLAYYLAYYLTLFLPCNQHLPQPKTASANHLSAKTVFHNYLFNHMHTALFHQTRALQHLTLTYSHTNYMSLIIFLSHICCLITMIFLWTHIIWIHCIRIDCFLILFHKFEDSFIICYIFDIHTMSMRIIM